MEARRERLQLVTARARRGNHAAEETTRPSANEEPWLAQRQTHDGGGDAGCACFFPSRS
jgi:hypothetical protein